MRKLILAICSFCLMLIMPFAIGLLSVNADTTPTTLTNAYVGKVYATAEGAARDIDYCFYFEDSITNEQVEQQQAEEYAKHIFIGETSIYDIHQDNASVVRLHFKYSDGVGYMCVNYWGTENYSDGKLIISTDGGLVSPNGTPIPAFTATFSSFNEGDIADELKPDPTTLTNAYVGEVYATAEGAPRDIDYYFYFEDSITDTTVGEQQREEYAKHVFVNGTSVYELRGEDNSGLVKLHFMAGDSHGFMRVNIWDARFAEGDIVITTDGGLVSPNGTPIPAFTATFSSFNEGDIADELKPEIKPTTFKDAKVSWTENQFIFFFNDNVVGASSVTGQQAVENYASYVYINGESVYNINQADSRYVRLHWMSGEGGYLRIDYYYNSENNVNDNVLITIAEGLVSPDGYEIPAMSKLFVNGDVGTVGVDSTIFARNVPVHFETSNGEDLTVTLNMGEATLNGVSVNGTALETEQYSLTGNTLTIDAEALAVGANTITLQTSNGEGAFVTSIIGNTTITEAKVKYANEQFIFQFNDVVIVGDSLTNQHTLDKYAQHIFINGKSIEEIHAENDAYVRMHWMSGEGSYLRIDYYYNSVNSINEPVWFSFDGELISPSGYRLPQTEVLFRSSDKGTVAESVKPFAEKERRDYLLLAGGDLTTKIWLFGANVATVEVNGNTVSTDNYEIDGNYWTLKPALFTAVGEYVFTVTTDKGDMTFIIDVVTGEPTFEVETAKIDQVDGGDCAIGLKTYAKEIVSVRLNDDIVLPVNYIYENDTLILRASFLNTLTVGVYELVVTTAIGSDTVTVNVVNTTPVLNGDSNVTFDVAMEDSLTIGVSLFGKDVAIYIGDAELVTAAYQITDGGIVFTKNYLKTLTSATTFVVRTASGEVSFTVTVIDSKPVLESDASVDYDKYTDSTVAIEVDLKGKTLVYVKANDTTLAETEYTYAEGVITLKETAIKALDGEVTVAIGTAGGEVVVTLLISDSTPETPSNDNSSCTSSISVGGLFAVVSTLACTAFIAKKSRKED